MGHGVPPVARMCVSIGGQFIGGVSPFSIRMRYVVVGIVYGSMSRESLDVVGRMERIEFSWKVASLQSRTWESFACCTRCGAAVASVMKRPASLAQFRWPLEIAVMIVWRVCMSDVGSLSVRCIQAMLSWMQSCIGRVSEPMDAGVGQCECQC